MVEATARKEETDVAEGPGSSTDNPPVSVDEIRQRRPTTFEPLETNTKRTPTVSYPTDANDSAITDTMESPLQNSSTTAGAMQTEEDEEIDAELQAALAMSLEQHAVTQTSAGERNGFPDPPDNSTVEEFKDDELILQACYESRQPFDVLGFHNLMWDASITTENDKLRWIGQGFQFGKSADNDASKSKVGQRVSLLEASSVTSTAALQMDARLSTFSPTKTNSTDALNSEQVTAEMNPQTWGLIQNQGGPCGILAAVQAEILRVLLWGRPRPFECPPRLALPQGPIGDIDSSSDFPPLTSEVMETVLAQAIAIIIARATLTPSKVPEGENGQDRSTTTDYFSSVKARVVLPEYSNGVLLDAGLRWRDLEPWSAIDTESSPSPTAVSSVLQTFAVEVPASVTLTGPKRQKRDGVGVIEETSSLEDKILRLARVISTFLMTPLQQSPKGNATSPSRPINFFQNSGGVLFLTMSIVASRGKSRIQNEFDDPINTRLTSQFGHCGQELINVCLIGQAVSNVFDNDVNLGETVCRGISSQPAIGYLSQLESMRYCEVGSYYKSPKFPVWVVGSTGHFTVLFGDADALRESQSDVLLERGRRAFKSNEECDENGFIQTSQLGRVLEALELNIGSETRVQTLAATLEVSGAGIILWEDFWKATSRLLTGATLEMILQGGECTAIDLTSEVDEPRPLMGMELLRHGLLPGNDDQKLTSRSNETDEEMARRLASEWELQSQSHNTTDGMLVLSHAAGVASPLRAESSGQQLSDEELARQLQAEWDVEVPAAGASCSIDAVNGSPTPVLSEPDELAWDAAEESDSKPSAKPTYSQNGRDTHLDLEHYGDSLPLCHYNGLQGGNLITFRVTKLSAVEAVGASTSLNGGRKSSGSGDLEDVVRTKWPSCIVDWLGNKPPFID